MSYSKKLFYIGKTGKEAFGQFIQVQDAGNYTLNKKSKYTYCDTNPCLQKKNSVANQGDYLLLKRANYLKYFNKIDNIRSIKTNLENGLITTLDLKDVSVIKNTTTGSSPTTLSTTSISYLDYTIDPSGSLFGNTICGLNNYENYLVYTEPYSLPNSLETNL
jgi:hypothetical protein